MRSYLLLLWLALAACLAATACGDKSKKGAKLSGAKVKDLSQRAKACFVQGDYACAMEKLRTVLKSRPDDVVVLNQFAMAARLRYYQSGDMDFRDQELEALRKAVKLAPKAGYVQVNFGTTTWELGMRKEAAKAYQRALELQPKHPDAPLMRTRIKRSTVEVEDEDGQ